MKRERGGSAGEVGLCHPLHFLLHSLYRLSVPPFPPGARGLMLPHNLSWHGGSGGNWHSFSQCDYCKACTLLGIQSHCFSGSLCATPWGRFIISVSQRLKLKLQEDKKLVQITQLINTKAEFEAQLTWLQNFWVPNCTRSPVQKKKDDIKLCAIEGFTMYGGEQCFSNRDPANLPWSEGQGTWGGGSCILWLGIGSSPPCTCLMALYLTSPTKHS